MSCQPDNRDRWGAPVAKNKRIMIESPADTCLGENTDFKQLCEKQQEIITALEIAVGDAGTQQLKAEFESLEILQFLSATMDPIWVVREDGIVIRANDAMLKLLNKDLMEVIGHKCSNLLDYGHCQKISCPLNNIKTRKQMEYEIQLNDKYYSVSLSPQVTIVGTGAIVAHFRNITKRKQVEKALEDANKRLSEIANIDGLTQIANRRAFDELIQREWLRLKRNQLPLSLILIDIDYFKKYNDYYGHSAGDDCLARVAAALDSSVRRPTDLAARYGGEEFVLLLPETPLEGALKVAMRTKETISQLKLPHHESDISDYVSISQGIACVIPSKEIAPVELIKQADKALYQIKVQGRNGFAAE